MMAHDLLSKAAALGVRVVQIADNLPLHHLAADDRERLREQADALRLQIEIGTGGIDADNLRAYVEIARQFHSKILRTVIDAGAERPSPDEVVARLKPLMPAFEEAGVTLAIENHDRFKAMTLLKIIERIGSDHVGICLDTSNSLGCLEGVEHVVKVLGPHVVNLHIKDVRVSRPPHHKGFIVEGCPAGQGQLDIPDLLVRLRLANREPNAIVELWPAPEPDLAAAIAKEDAWARQSVAYLRPLITD
jgi:sugar phosphate isomerase/epimerase